MEFPRAKTTDEQLVAASIAGDHDAFRVIVLRYQGLVTGLIYNRCRGNLAKSEELSQDTFVAAWKSLPSLQNAEQLSSWLCGIARNVVNSAFRVGHEVEASATTLIEDEKNEVASRADDPSHQAVLRERSELIWQTLSAIPAMYREPMILYYRQQQSAAEVAHALNLNETTVRKRLQRGREMLKEQIASQVEDFLTDTSPNANFSFAVMAALPGIGASTATGTVGGGALLGTIGSKLLSLFFWLGPLMGIVAGVWGVAQSVQAAESQREKRFFLHRGITIFVIVGLFMGLQFGMSRFRDSMSGNTFVTLTAISWMLLAIVVAGYTWLGRVTYRKIRPEHGDANEAKPWPKAQIYLGPAIGLVGGMSWILALAALAGDWSSFVTLVVACAVLYWWTTRALLRQSAAIGIACCSNLWPAYSACLPSLSTFDFEYGW